jgi:protein-disulfide isomerase
MASRKEQREAAREARMEEEQRAAADARRKRMTQLGVGGVFLAAIVVVVLVVISQSGGGSDTTTAPQEAVTSGKAESLAGTQDVEKQLRGIPQSGNVLGDPQANVTVVEFGDPQCPVCKAFSEQVVPQFIASTVRSGKAKYEFKPWVIIGPQSKPASAAALAAGEQDHFFNYIELFYRNQGEENSGYVTNEFMTAIAKGAQVPDIARWNKDRGSAKWPPMLSAIDSEANQLGLSGTPSIQIVGPKGKKVLSGIPNAAQLEAEVKAAQ